MKPLPAFAFLILLLGFLAGGAHAKPFTRAELSQVVNEVNLLIAAQQSRPASVGDTVSGRTAVSTGTKSRAELTFPDETLMRLGSNTYFTLRSGTRDVNLERGAVLLQTSERGGPARIRAGSVTAAITGSMGIVSLSPPQQSIFSSKVKELILKYVLFHGSGSFNTPGRDYPMEPWTIAVAKLDPQGNIIAGPEFAAIDVDKAGNTSLLVNGFDDNSRLDFDDLQNEYRQLASQKDQNTWAAVSTDTQNKTLGLFGLFAKKRNQVNPPIAAIISTAPAPKPPVVASKTPGNSPPRGPVVNSNKPQPPVGKKPPVVTKKPKRPGKPKPKPVRKPKLEILKPARQPHAGSPPPAGPGPNQPGTFSSARRKRR